jgi:hypothetical protein
VRAGHVRAGHVRAGHVRAGHVRAGHVHSMQQSKAWACTLGAGAGPAFSGPAPWAKPGLGLRRAFGRTEALMRPECTVTVAVTSHGSQIKRNLSSGVAAAVKLAVCLCIRIDSQI